MSWRGLPAAVRVGGRDWAAATDFRDILDIIGRLTDEESPAFERLYLALGLFYDEFDDMPEELYPDAYAALCRFIACGEEEGDGPAVKLLDWEQDERLIAAEINKAAGCEVRALPYLHWWTFIGYFSGIGEGRFATVVSIRSKLKRGKKLEKWERDYYRDNKKAIDLRRKYTAEEKAEMERLKKLLDG